MSRRSTFGEQRIVVRVKSLDDTLPDKPFTVTVRDASKPVPYTCILSVSAPRANVVVHVVTAEQISWARHLGQVH